jgi:hypothetical protein
MEPSHETHVLDNSHYERSLRLSVRPASPGPRPITLTRSMRLSRPGAGQIPDTDLVTARRPQRGSRNDRAVSLEVTAIRETNLTGAAGARCHRWTVNDRSGFCSVLELNLSSFSSFFAFRSTAW